MRFPMMTSLAAAFALAGGTATADEAPGPLAVGDKAPAIDSFDQDGKPVKLGEQFATGTTLVWFYPKANTSG